MNNIHTIRIWEQYFLLILFIAVFYGTIAFAEESLPEEDTDKTTIASNKYINTLETIIGDYKRIANSGGWPLFKMGKTIKYADNDERVSDIRGILSVMGDYKGEKNNESDELNEELLEAIKRFQKRHGLNDDGVVGRKTQKALSVSIESRLVQMQATLERMYKMPDLEKRYVLVNIPGFYLKAIDGETTSITSRIIVGTRKNATPLFHRAITDVSFNPPWYVPERIARTELMGKLRADPEYFIKKNYKITDIDGETIDANNVDWENQYETYRFVQRAGRGSALGKVKFNLPDTSSIFLHSTPNPKLFSKSERALSHGCIRVEQARELTLFVMNGSTRWSDERVAKLYDSNRSRIIKVENPVQVYLAYWTSWVDEKTGQLHFNKDIYGRDKKRVAELMSILVSEKEKDDLQVAMQ